MKPEGQVYPQDLIPYNLSIAREHAPKAHLRELSLRREPINESKTYPEILTLRAYPR